MCLPVILIMGFIYFCGIYDSYPQQKKEFKLNEAKLGKSFDSWDSLYDYQRSINEANDRAKEKEKYDYEKRYPPTKNTWEEKHRIQSHIQKLSDEFLPLFNGMPFIGSFLNSDGHSSTKAPNQFVDSDVLIK
jgi:hypothetical protein